MARKATGRPNGRPATSRAPKDPHGLSYYIRRAEVLLAGLTATKESLTLDDRAMLERHLERAREIASKPDPLTISEKRAVLTFVEIVGALGPRLQTLRNRAEGDWAAEIKATVDRATAKARVGKAKKRGRGLEFDSLLVEMYQPEMQPKDLLEPFNARLRTLDKPPISKDALGKHMRKLRRLIEGRK